MALIKSDQPKRESNDLGFFKVWRFIIFMMAWLSIGVLIFIFFSNSKTLFMKFYKIIFSLFFLGIIFTSCKKDKPIVEPITPAFEGTKMVDVGGHKLFTETKGEGNHTIIFESGLGADSDDWRGEIFNTVTNSNQAIIYNRAGYDPSENAGNDPRDVIQLAEELHKVITELSQNEKVILVGHSLGGVIIRYYAHQYPEKVEGLLFVDPSHEDELDLSEFQNEVNNLFQFLLSQGQTEVAKEVKELYENALILKALPNLPNVPVQVLTSMKLEDDGEIFTPEEKQTLFDIHASLGEGVDDFTHITTIQSGHQIHMEEPNLVLILINALVN